MLIFSDKFDQLKKADKAVKSPKYLQEVMGIGRIAENGIFEVGKGYIPGHTVFWILTM